jgi:hypothetical protein
VSDSTPTVTDDDRHRIEEAIAASALLMYLGAKREAHYALGVSQAPAADDDQRAEIIDFAAQRAQLVQTGINTRVAAAVAALGDRPAEDEVRAAVHAALAEIATYHAAVLIPYITSWAYHRGLVDAYHETIDPATGRPHAESQQWIWTQTTDCVDDCTEAAAASPASVDDLIAIAGGPPPAHPRCACDLAPADSA